MEISVLIEKAQAGDASARKILIEDGGSVPDRNDRTDESD